MEWLEISMKAVLIAVFLGVSGGMLGCVLVMRRMSLMGDALSHSLLPGVGLAYLLFGESLPALFGGALIAGLLTALLSGMVNRQTRLKEDASFGAMYIILFAAGVILVGMKGQSEELLHLLFGDLHQVGLADLWLAAFVSSATLLAFALFYRNILLETFDPVFYRSSGGSGTLTHLGILVLVVLNLVAALQTMGVVLALGLFILPAVTAYLWCERWSSMLLLSVIIAISASLISLPLQLVILAGHEPNISSRIVLLLGLAFFFSVLFSPRHGIVNRGAATKPRRAE